MRAEVLERIVDISPRFGNDAFEFSLESLHIVFSFMINRSRLSVFRFREGSFVLGLIDPGGCVIEHFLCENAKHEN